MDLTVAFLPHDAGDVSSSVCIVIDVLRATTVLATMFDRGARHVYVSADYDQAARIGRERDMLICGEIDGFKAPGFDFGNSPAEFSRMDLTGREMVLSTSNGTKAAVAVSGARAVYLGASVNLSAVASAAFQSAKELEADLVVVCSGTGGRFTLEDATVAGLYVEALVANAGAWDMPSLADSAMAARRLWQSEPNLLRGWMEGRHARHLGDIGFGEDLGFCCAIDTSRSVPMLTGGASVPVCPVSILL